jgi:photosystem II stability/assembly factor-like uncharacterized protein
MRSGKRIQRFGVLIVSVCFSFLQVDSHADEDPSASVDVNLFASAVLSGGDSVMVGDRGKVFLSRGGAGTWREIESGTTRALVTVCFPNDRHGWIAGQGGVILHTDDGGRTWTVQSSGVEAYLLDIDFVDPYHGVTVGADSTVLFTTDGGATWQNAPLGTSPDLAEEINLFAAVMMDDQKACIAGDRGRIFTSEDGGKRWVESKSPLYDEKRMEGRILYSMTYDSGILYAVGIDGVLVTSTDQGKTWKERATGFPGPELYCIDVVSGVGLAAGSGGHILGTSDGGTTWRVMGVPEEIKRSWLSGIDLKETATGGFRGLLVGQDGTVGRLENGALSW